MEKQFEPFECVLVRHDGQSEWTTGIYSRIGKNCTNETIHICAGGGLPYKECIPYNENTKHLLGTTKPYEQPKPKTYQVEWVSGNKVGKVEYTDEEFENFIKTAVLHNKDISNFNVRKICG